MTWVLIGALGVAAWLSAAVLMLGLCRAASRANQPESVRPASSRRSISVSGESNVLDLCAFRAVRARATIGAGVVAKQAARSYFSSLESRRSLSSLPSVWQVGQ
jgi:hypothetical protein